VDGDGDEVGLIVHYNYYNEKRPELKDVRAFSFFPQALFVSCGSGFCGRCLRGWVVGNSRVKHGVELADVRDFGVALLSDDEDAWSLVQIDALAEGLVSPHLGSEETVGVDDEGHHPAMRLKVFLGEGVKVILGSDGDLVGKDGAAVVFGGLRRDLVLDVAGDDGGVPAPDVHLEGEVLADKGDLVLLDGRMDYWKGVGASRALEVFELVDGDGDASGSAQHGGVTVTRRLGESWNAGGKGEEQGGG
jgi:hypothetical protein